MAQLWVPCICIICLLGELQYDWELQNLGLPLCGEQTISSFASSLLQLLLGWRRMPPMSAATAWQLLSQRISSALAPGMLSTSAFAVPCDQQILLSSSTAGAILIRQCVRTWQSCAGQVAACSTGSMPPWRLATGATCSESLPYVPSRHKHDHAVSQSKLCFNAMC